MSKYVNHWCVLFPRFSSSTYTTSGRSVAVRYTQGDWQGELGTDLITIPQGPNGTISINMAAILTSNDFFLPGINWQGILGLAYPLLARVRDAEKAHQYHQLNVLKLSY